MRTSRPRVAILTTLTDFSPAYSLVGIILDQARMLKRGGYDYDLLCLKYFNHKEWDAKALSEELSIRFVLAKTVLHDYQVGDPPKEAHKDEHGNLIQGFDQQVATHLNGDRESGGLGYFEVLKDYDVIIDHDIMFLSWFLVQNAALRHCIEKWPEKSWIHWVHSGPSPRPQNICYPTTLRFEQAPESTYVYLNNTQKHDYALMIGAQDKDVRVVYNPKDVRDVWGFGDLTCSLIDRYNLLDHEVFEVYPFSSPRWIDKGVKQLMRIFGFMKKQGVKAKLVLINAHCNSPRDVSSIEGMEAYAQVCGLTLDEDLIMSSRYSDEVEAETPWKNRKLRYTVPFRTVRELVMVSNLFIFPTASECCSLIQAEASMAGKFMVLNQNFLPLLEFCTEGVMHFEFTGNNPDTNPTYYECVAREIIVNFRAEASIVNRTRAITRTYNRDWIFKNQLEPLLYLGASKERVETEVPREILRPELVRETVPPIEIEVKEVTATQTQPPVLIPSILDVGEIAPNYNDPQPGMECAIFDRCSEHLKSECYRQTGHCMMLDEIDHGQRQREVVATKEKAK